MKYIFLKYRLFFILIVAIAELHAQEAITVAGGSVSGIDGSLSYSVGQVFYQNQTGSAGAMSEGVQQSYYISVIKLITGTEDIQLSIGAYPNPVTHILYLTVDNYKWENMTCFITDIQGKILQQVKITGSKTSIGMEQLPPSIYIMNLVNENHFIKSFKNH